MEREAEGRKPVAVKTLLPDFNLPVLAISAAISASVWAAEARAQTNFGLLAQNCAACHNSAAMPITEMSRERLLQTLLRFKSGESYSTIMGRILEPFEEDDIKNLVEALKSKEAE